jgi:hypothetical protein
VLAKFANSSVNPLETTPVQQETEQQDKDDEVDEDEVVYGEVRPAVTTQLVHTSLIEYKQARGANKWKRVRMLFFTDRIALLSAHANVDRFLAALLHASESTESTRFSHKTIMLSDMIKSKFSSSSSGHSNAEFYLKFVKSSSSAAVSSSYGGKSSIIRLRCANREEKAHWHRIFNRYLIQ